MQYVEIPQAHAQRALDLFRFVGFSHYGQPTQQAFEEHITSNKKIVSLHGEVAAEIANIEFYDELHEVRELTPGVMEGNRRFRWEHRFMQIQQGLPLEPRLIFALAHDDFYEGFPLGIITDDPTRLSQLEQLGTVTDAEFSKIIMMDHFEIRLYDRFRDLPTYQPGMDLPGLH